MKVASFDIGSNTLLMLIAEVRDGGLVRVVDECRFGRLGEGLDESGRLSDAALERSLGAMREYAAELAVHDVAVVAAVGTQALREADNSAAFVEPAEKLAGCSIEIIAGEREAELVHRAVATSLPDVAAGAFVICDVGGGSTEFIVGSATSVDSFTSIPIGAVRMSERHLKDDPPTRDQMRALYADIDEQLAGLALPADATLVGSAGTATTFATVEQRLRHYDPDKAHGFTITTAQVERITAKFAEVSLSERKRIPGLEPQRADVIIGGAAIYARVLSRMGATSMIVSDRGVRWGLAYELAAEAGIHRR